MLKLVSSNEGKLKEYQSFGLTDLVIEKGVDHPEVDSDALTVIIYKSIAAGNGTIVEDTSLHVEGADVGVNVRWVTENLHEYDGHGALWEVLLGVNDGQTIRIYRGEVRGKITNRFHERVGFAFDCRFIPDGENYTFYELEQNGRKEQFSARKKVIENYVNECMFHEVKISDVPAWHGGYQH